MRGTDLTEWQIKSAEKFLRMNSSANPESNDSAVSLRFGDLVRVVAWYGQIRAQSVAQGASPDQPGEPYVATHEITD